MMSLKLCRKPQVSSAYTPNTDFTNRFSDPRRFDVISTVDIPTKKLDYFEITNPDFIKLDIQGGELNALQGAEQTLESVFGLEIEVEFLPLYVGQPLFGDISSFLSKRGFEFIDFVNLTRWEREKHNYGGQCVFGDALFLKTPVVIISKELSAENILLSWYFVVI